GGTVSGRVLLFTSAVALLSGVITSLVPAMQASDPDLNAALKAGSREGSVQRSRTRTVLLVAQAALAIILLSGSGLFLRSLRNVASLDLGLDINHAVIGRISQGSVGLGNEESLRLFEESALRVGTLPGATATAVTIALPFSMSAGVRLALPGREAPKAQSFQYA